ncbi:MAG: SDR family oxidoreductase [Bacteroidetes bacterium]|nr:MAG: SDR family oxidoreductase [Bacteroidota bacterium]
MPRQIIVVGASRGIGLKLVELLAENQENHILALSRNQKGMEKLLEHPNVECAHFDLGGDSVKQQLTELTKNLDRVDVLINNAGKLVNKPFPELQRADFLESYQVNLFGVMETVQALLPKMEQGCHIVNISSMGGFQGSIKFPGLTAYSGSKAALCNFTELFAEEYKESQIRMNCLCLGAVQTEMLEEAFPGYQAPLSAEEMAAYISWFALQGGRYFNGKILPVSLSTP